MLPATVVRFSPMSVVACFLPTLGQSDLRVHYGVGRIGRIDRLEIRWASAATDVIEKLDANQVITVREGGGVVERRPFATTGSKRETQASGKVPPLR